jgi:hypothetical protein
MNPLIESLECRKLLSASLAVAELAAAAKHTEADFSALEAVGKSNFKLIEADLKVFNEFKSSGALLKNLGIEAKAADSVLSRGLKKSDTLLTADVKKLEAAAKSLAKKPTSASLQAKVSAADNTLHTDAGNRLSTVTADITAEKDISQTNVEALLAANPANTLLKTDVDTTISVSSAAARTALRDSATTTLTTDVAAVIAAFPA